MADAARKSKKEKPWYAKIPVIGKRLTNVLSPDPVVPVLRLAGVIGEGGRLRQGGINLADLAESIDRAFEDDKIEAVALIVNSPGGSPVQSDLIAKRIRLMAAEKNKPVLAFCEDAAASGGYWLACAADEIYAADASVIGSIGVISAGFGFTDLIEKIGVQRRVYTAGEAKSQLDPFQPENDGDIKRLKALQKNIHRQFTTWIKERRSDKLKASDKKLFSGEFWTGQQALDLGLVDGLGEIRTICREKYGETVQLRLVTPRKNWIQKRLGLDSRATGMDGLPNALIDAAEHRAWWSRLGL